MAMVHIVSSVKLLSEANNSKSVVWILANSYREPTISPIIEPNIMVNEIGRAHV